MAKPTLRASGWKEYARLQSKTDPDKTYRVDKHEDNGAYRCGCKGFVFSRQFTLVDGREQKVCKHLAYMFALDTQPRQTATARPNVVLDQAVVILTDVLRAGGLFANTAATSKMALVLASKLAEYAPPAIAAPRPTTAPTLLGVRVITFDD